MTRKQALARAFLRALLQTQEEIEARHAAIAAVSAAAIDGRCPLLCLHAAERLMQVARGALQP